MRPGPKRPRAGPMRPRSQKWSRDRENILYCHNGNLLNLKLTETLWRMIPLLCIFSIVTKLLHYESRGSVMIIVFGS